MVNWLHQTQLRNKNPSILLQWIPTPILGFSNIIRITHHIPLFKLYSHFVFHGIIVLFIPIKLIHVFFQRHVLRFSFPFFGRVELFDACNLILKSHQLSYCKALRKDRRIIFFFFLILICAEKGFYFVHPSLCDFVHFCATKFNDVIKDIDFYDSNVIVIYERNSMFM